jgi:hypothetical protein
MKRLFLCSIIAAVSAIGAACDEKLSSITGPTPDLAPNLSAIQRTIFNVTDSTGRLACTGCHTDAAGRVPPNNLVLLEGRAYSQLVGRVAFGKPGATLVVPGDPDNSYLIKKLQGAADIAGQRMPRGSGPFLSEGQILVIKAWIRDGAQNN